MYSTYRQSGCSLARGGGGGENGSWCLPPSRFSGVVLVCCFPREGEREEEFPSPINLAQVLLQPPTVSTFLVSLSLSPGLLCAHIRVYAHSGEKRERESASVGGCSYFPFLPLREKKTEEEEVRTKRQLQPYQYNKSGKGRRRLWGQKQEGKRKGFKLGKRPSLNFHSVAFGFESLFLVEPSFASFRSVRRRLRPFAGKRQSRVQ